MTTIQDIRDLLHNASHMSKKPVTLFAGDEMKMAHISAEDGQWIVGATLDKKLVYRRGRVSFLKTFQKGFIKALKAH